MTISKGSSWGEERATLSLATFAQLPTIEILTHQSLIGDQPTLVRSDNPAVKRYLGLTRTAELSTANEFRLYRWDVLQVSFGQSGTTQKMFALANVVVGNAPLVRTGTAIINVDLDAANTLSPKSHPNDGRVEVVQWQLSARDRLARWVNRVDSLTMVSQHRSVTKASVKSYRIDLPHTTPVWIDGQRHDAAGIIEITLIADAVSLAMPI